MQEILSPALHWHLLWYQLRDKSPIYPFEEDKVSFLSCFNYPALLSLSFSSLSMPLLSLLLSLRLLLSLLLLLPLLLVVGRLMRLLLSLEEVLEAKKKFVRLFESRWMWKKLRQKERILESRSGRGEIKIEDRKWGMNGFLKERRTDQEERGEGKKERERERIKRDLNVSTDPQIFKS